MKHIIESQQFDRELLQRLFERADHHSKNRSSTMRGQIMASLFYEPSTRTRFSFEATMLRLGGGVISTENAHEFSSAAKGETLEDSIIVVGAFADVIVLRHFEEGAAKRAGEVSSVPVINAGDGPGQHPTQALLDLYTIWKEVGHLDQIHVAMIGDLKHGRTIRSLSYLLGKYDDIKISFVSPRALRVRTDVKQYLAKHGVEYVEKKDWRSTLKEADVIYQTRIQKERFNSPPEYRKHERAYVLSKREAVTMKEGSIIMHPLPRVGEIQAEVDSLPQAKYFKQVEYGLYVRMALLEYALGKMK